jgi:hypothetical protein
MVAADLCSGRVYFHVGEASEVSFRTSSHFRTGCNLEFEIKNRKNGERGFDSGGGIAILN